MATLRVGMNLDSSAFNQGLNRAQKDVSNFAKQSSDAVKSVMRSALMGLGAYLGTQKIISFAQEAITLANTQEKAVSSVRAALEATGFVAGFTTKQLEEMASDFQNKSTFGDEKIMQEGMNTLLKFRNIRGEVFQEGMQSVLDLSAKSGQSLQSTADQLGKALNNPLNAMKSLRTLGVTLNDTQQELLKTYIDQGDVVSAQKLILGEVQAMSKGTAEAMANTQQGKIEQLKNAVGDLKEEFGFVLLNVMDTSPLVQALTEKVQLLIGWLKENGAMLAGGIQVFFVEVWANMLKFRQYGENLFANLIIGVMNLWERISSVFTWLWDNSGKIFSNLWELIIAYGKDVFNLWKNIGSAIWDAVTGKGVSFDKIINDFASEMKKAAKKAGMSELTVNKIDYIKMDEGIAQIEADRDRLVNSIMDGVLQAEEAMKSRDDKEKAMVEAAKNTAYSLPGITQKVNEKTVAETTIEDKAGFVDRMQKGSKEAYQAVLKATGGNQNKGVEDATKANGEVLLRIAETLEQQEPPYIDVNEMNIL